MRAELGESVHGAPRDALLRVRDERSRRVLEAYTPLETAMRTATGMTAALLVAGLTAQVGAADINLHPEVKQLRQGSGTFTAPETLTIVVNSAIAQADANGALILQEKLAEKKIAARIVRADSAPSGQCVVMDGFGAYPLATAAMIEAPEKELPPEGYFVSVSSDRIVAGAVDRRGLVCAALTIAQLFDAKTRSAPAVSIIDWPSLSFRASHLQVPVITLQGVNILEDRLKAKPAVYEHFRTMADYIKLFDLYAQKALDGKMNAILIELNQGFRFAAYPNMALPQSVDLQALKPVIERINRYYAHAIPNFNLFAHQEHFLGVARPDLMLIKLRRVPKKAKNGYDEVFYYEPIYDPHSKEVQQIVTRCIDEAMLLFGRPRYIHIGHDECDALRFVLRKKTKEIVDLFSYSVNYLSDYVREKHGARAMIWGDMLLSTRSFGVQGRGNTPGAPIAASIGDLSKDVIICDWQYYPHTPSYPIVQTPETDKFFPTSLYFSENGFHVVGATLVFQQLPEGHKLWQEKREPHSRNFANFIRGLPRVREPGEDGKGVGLGMIVTNWYMNPVTYKFLQRDKLYGLKISCEHFWNSTPNRKRSDL